VHTARTQRTSQHAHMRAHKRTARRQHEPPLSPVVPQTALRISHDHVVTHTLLLLPTPNTFFFMNPVLMMAPSAAQLAPVEAAKRADGSSASSPATGGGGGLVLGQRRCTHSHTQACTCRLRHTYTAYTHALSSSSSRPDVGDDALSRGETGSVLLLLVLVTTARANFSNLCRGSSQTSRSSPANLPHPARLLAMALPESCFTRCRPRPVLTAHSDTLSHTHVHMHTIQ
jgi:hypothetical protein